MPYINPFHSPTTHSSLIYTITQQIMKTTTHIAVVPGPGYSHLVPILEFSKRLVHLLPHLHVTSIIPTFGSLPSVSKTFLETLPPNITLTFLPPINPNDLPQGLATGVQMQLTITYSLPFLHQALKSLTSRTHLVALVVDNFAYEALDFAKEFNLLSYIYFPKSALTLSMYFYLPKLHKESSCEFRDLPEPIKMPGCVPLHGCDLHHQIQDRSSQGYELFLQRVKQFCFVDGIFINSFPELETGPIRELTKKGSVNPPVYPVGPIIQKGVPLIAWPLFAEQRMNAVMLSDGLKVALRPRVNGNGIVEREEVAEVVKSLMEVKGEKMRKIMKELKEAAVDALKEDGSSTKTLCQATAKWM
ncbi:putative hydroquinone glucosyltransferase-like [Sesbania bispinosa]|nr:putative hydroquinone glucosyltransferase-like [Sesbania bispinosa]